MVGIIPKPIEKPPSWQNIALYTALGLIVVVVLSYAALFYLEKKASDNLGNLEEEIGKIGTKEEKGVEARVLLAGKRIDDFSTLFQQHKKISNFLKMVEENCHPNVQFTEMELLPNDVQVNLSGKTPTFQTLGQQMLIFQSQASVKEITLNNLSIGKGGQTEFTLSLFLDPAIFQ